MNREVLGAILGSYTRLITEIGEIKEYLLELKSAMPCKNVVEMPQSWKRTFSGKSPCKSGTYANTVSRQDTKTLTLEPPGDVFANECNLGYERSAREGSAGQYDIGNGNSGGTEFCCSPLSEAPVRMPFPQKEARHAKGTKNASARPQSSLRSSKTLADSKAEIITKTPSKRGDRSCSKLGPGQRTSKSFHIPEDPLTIGSTHPGSTTKLRASSARTGSSFKRISRVQEVYQENRSFTSYQELFPVLERETNGALEY